MVPAAPSEIESFYRTGALGLRALETREARGRRFGEHADATWRAFRGNPGELGDADRLDLLLRDAAALHRAACAPSVVFAIPGLATDEPFGPDWPSAPATLARDLVREGTSPIDLKAPAELVEKAATLWHLVPAATASVTDAVRSIGPASRVVAAGAGAIVALTKHFQGRSDMDLADQVLLVTQRPAERQLFGLAVLALGSTSPTRFLSPGEDAKAASGGRVHVALVSDDASPASGEAALAVAKETRGG